LTKLNEDVVVPRGRLEDLFRFAETLQRRHKFQVACFGHAGDGNIHVNVMIDQSDSGAAPRSEAALDDLFRQVLAWKGVITGEHGIGLAKKRWWPDAASPEVRDLHVRVKRALDPEGILNPGKFVRT
jgi:glycolate oxidase